MNSREHSIQVQKATVIMQVPNNSPDFEDLYKRDGETVTVNGVHVDIIKSRNRDVFPDAQGRGFAYGDYRVLIGNSTVYLVQ